MRHSCGLWSDLGTGCLLGHINLLAALSGLDKVNYKLELNKRIHAMHAIQLLF